jgi:1-acyl-sn-glycerol-3-phosphate acyltransferase
LVKRGYSIAIYPEGTRSKDCKIGRFHKGAFYVAEQLGLEIIPMYLYGPGRILPKKTYHLRKGPIYLEVGDPIKREQLEAVGDVKAQASSMRKAYIAKYETIANQIEKDV